MCSWREMVILKSRGVDVVTRLIPTRSVISDVKNGSVKATISLGGSSLASGQLISPIAICDNLQGDSLSPSLLADLINPNLKFIQPACIRVDRIDTRRRETHLQARRRRERSKATHPLSSRTALVSNALTTPLRSTSKMFEITPGFWPCRARIVFTSKALIVTCCDGNGDVGVTSKRALPK